MAERGTDFKDRKDKILAITIEKYINTVSPEGSHFIEKELNRNLSSATIRNVLADLERDGYLTHPHTSAGRIPTEKGYRYYVDHLMQEIKLLEEEKTRIKTQYRKERLELEDLLNKTSQMLSDMTHYTSIISVDGWGSKIFCSGTSFVVEYPDSQDIHKIKNILAALEQKERLLDVINKNLASRIEIFIGHEMALREVDQCSLVVSGYKFKTGPSGRIAVLGPTRMNYERVVSTLNYISDLIEEIHQK